jgi:hypothetical protein
LNGGIKFRRYLIDFRTKILKIPPDFSTSVGKSICTMRQIMRALDLPRLLVNVPTDQTV